MRHARAGKKLGRDAAHRKALYSNLAGALITHGRIQTTEAKAKAVKPFAEKMITLGKRGDLHARRKALAELRSQDVVHELFAEVAPRFAERPGGYTRIIKLGARQGDAAEMVYLELVDYEPENALALAGRGLRRQPRAARGTRRSESVPPYCPLRPRTASDAPARSRHATALMTRGASSRPISATISRSRWSRCCSITRSTPALSYARSCSAASSSVPRTDAAPRFSRYSSGSPCCPARARRRPMRSRASSGVRPIAQAVISEMGIGAPTLALTRV